MLKIKFPKMDFPSKERLDEILAINILQLQIENELNDLVCVYKEEVKNLDDDFLEDSHSAMGASAAYSRVIKDLERILNLKRTSSIQEIQHNKESL